MSLLIGAAIGLAAAVIWGYRRGRRIYKAQLERFEPDIPRWVNQGNQQPIIISLAQLQDEINFAIWETEMEDR